MYQKTAYPLSEASSDQDSRKKVLLESLYTALRIEHSTIPPYLFALLSIKDPVDANAEAARILRSVAMEEMLHMALVANLINAIQEDASGRQKSRYLDLLNSKFPIDYPAPLPGTTGEFDVALRPFSKEAIELFLKIEQPEESDQPPVNGKYHSIGQFYTAIRQEIDDFCEEFGEGELFHGNTERQLTEEYYYNGGGEIIQVNSLESARRAITIIVDEGEGSNSIWSGDDIQFGEVRDLAHYYKFNQLSVGRYYQLTDKPSCPPSGDPVPVNFDLNQIYRANADISLEDYPALDKMRNDCNELYWRIIGACEKAFNGEQQALEAAIISMHSFREKAIFLMRMEVEGTEYNAGPDFKFDSNFAL